MYPREPDVRGHGAGLPLAHPEHYEWSQGIPTWPEAVPSDIGFGISGVVAAGELVKAKGGPRRQYESLAAEQQSRSN